MCLRAEERQTPSAVEPILSANCRARLMTSTMSFYESTPCMALFSGTDPTGTAVMVGGTVSRRHEMSVVE